MSVRRFDKYSVLVRGVAAGLCCVLAAPGEALLLAQAAATQAAKPAAGEAAATAVKLTADQLDSLVAPIALYPDPLLSQALVASTYPLELVQAQQWLERNKTLTGDALSKAVEKQPWDPSVQATAVIPDLLKRLTEDITWTHNLGNAFLEQQADVMDAVQRLRGKAKEAGKLDTTEQQKVETKVVETKTIIEIQPTSTQVVYVPTYSPTVIWGPPLYYPYPPIYYPPYPPGAAWVGFGVGVMVGIGISGGWGYGCGWGGGGNVYINHNNNFVRTNNIRTGNINSGNTNWNHNPSHRGGAPYSNRSTATKYGGTTRGQATTRASGAGSASANRAGGASTQSANRAGASSAASSRPSGGGDKVGSRSVPQTSTRSGSSGFSGASGGASRASGASSRGGSSMGSRGGGGRRR